MSLFTFTASATHTATTNETINNTVIINFLSLIFNLLSCLSFDDAKVRLFANTDNILISRIFELRSKIGGISEISK